MSVDAYKIAIQLSLVENVAKGLASLAPHFNNANLSVKKLELRLERIGKFALTGGAMAGVGTFLVKGLINPSLEAAKDLAKATADFETLNLSASENSEVKAKALNMSHQVLGTTIAGNIRLIQDLHTAFGSLDHAMPMAEDFAKYETAIKGAYGEKAADGLVNAAAKALEHRGGSVTNDHEAFNKELLMMSQAQFATKGRVSSKDFLAMSQTGKMAYQMWDKEFLYGKAAAMATIYGGEQLGTMGMTAFSGLLGGHMDGKAKGFLADLGLYQEGFSKARLKIVADATKNMTPEQKRVYTQSMGGGQVLTGGLKDDYASMMAKDPSKFAAILADAVKARYGVDDPDKIAEIIAKNFNRNTGAFLGGLVTNAQKLIKDEAVFKRAMDYNQAFDHYQNAPDGAANALHAAFTNLKAVMGTALLPSVISATISLAKFVDVLSGFFERNAWAAKTVMWFTAIASAALFMGGALFLWRAAMLGLSIVSPMLYGIAVGIRALSFALISNPIGLIFLGIAAAAFLVYNNWTEIFASLKTMWGLIKDGFTKLFNGDILGAWYSFSGLFLKGWQMLLNTMISAANLIPGVNIGKMTFADDYTAKHSGSSNNVRAGSKNIVINPAPVILDGKQVTSVVFKHAGKEANRPNTGGGLFDPVMNFRPVGIN